MIKNSILRLAVLIALSVLLFAASVAVSLFDDRPRDYFADPAQMYPSTPNAAPTTYELQQVSAKTGSAAKYLDAFWRRTFAANNVSYSSPRIVPTGRAAFYNQATDAIHYDPAFLALQMRSAARQMGTDGDFAFIVILAHEWGHAVQKRLGLTRGRTIDRELQADCLAGAFAKAARSAGLLDPGDLDEATFAFLMARDRVGTNPDHPTAHGTGDQRVRAFTRGLDGGVKTCGCF